MICKVGFVNCFCRVPVVFQPFCPVPCCQGKLGNSQENSNNIAQFILSLSMYVAAVIPAPTNSLLLPSSLFRRRCQRKMASL